MMTPNKQSQKICKWCRKKYADKTKRKVGKTCSKQCAYSLGAHIRKKKGSYKITKEHAKKIGETLKTLRQKGELTTPPTIRKKLSLSLKEKWQTGEMLRKSRETCLKKYGVEHHMKLNKYKELTRKKHTGKIATKETLKRMSVASQKQNNRFSRCKGGYREDLKKYFRSSWEANYARMLNHHKIKWEYESKTFDLLPGKTYTPDFFLPDFNVHIELKGWETTKYLEKIKLFKEKYPNVTLIIVRRKQYKKLNYKYRNVIPNWEKSK